MSQSLSRLLLLVFLSVAVPAAQAQSWQWGIRGGGYADGLNISPEEESIDVATDKLGNLYTLSVIEASGMPTLGNDAGAITLPTYGNRDILISSQRCDGTVRWTHVIGSNDNDEGRFIAADTLGHVFVAGYTAPQRNVYFGSDTTLMNNKEMFVAAYDTSGNFLWLRYPASDTIPLLNQNRNYPFDMTADADGTLNLLAFLSPGLLADAGNWVVPEEGVYLLRYNAQGNIIQLTPMQIGLKGYATLAQNYVTDASLRMAHTPQGRWIVAGSYFTYIPTAPFLLGGLSVTNSAYVASFRADGQLFWVRTNDSVYSEVGGRPVTDDHGDIYVTGSTWQGETINGIGVQTGASGSIPMVWKLDSNGHNHWLSYASGNTIPYMGTTISAGTGSAAIALGNGEVAITGGCGALAWGGQSIVGEVNSGYGIFIARLNSATGDMIKLDSIIRFPGYYCSANAIATAKNGSYYVGGQFGAAFFINGDTLYHYGGYSDFFMAKYGYPCDCTPPAAGITVSGMMSSLTHDFSYNGAGAADSVVWDFGDGATANGTSVTHTYASAGLGYTACAVAYSNCGTDMACADVSPGSTGLSAPPALAHLRVYPNPATDHLSISGAAEGSTYRLLSLTGQTMRSGRLNGGEQQVSLAGLASGMYMLEVSAQGARTQLRVVKD